MVFVSIVTAPVRASVLPTMFTPVVTVIDAIARMFPLKDENVPRVAELPTCQKTLQASAPLMRLTMLADAVVSVLCHLEDEDGIRVVLGVERQRPRDPERTGRRVVGTGLQRRRAGKLRTDLCGST